MSIVIMILLLSFLVLIHEAGHFCAARMLGIKVSKFGFGLPVGPTLWSKKVGDVEVLVHACLLGGYVSFPDDEKDCDIPLDSKDRFINRPVWQRMIVISAGVIANVIIAFVLVLITAFVLGQLPSGSEEVYIDKIIAAKGETIWNSGLKSGDRVVKINGTDINSTYALILYVKNSSRNDGKVDEVFMLENLSKLKKLNPTLSENEVIKENTLVRLPEKAYEPELKIDKEALRGYKLYKDSQISLTENQIKLRNELVGKTSYNSDGKSTLKDLALALSDGQRPINLTVLRDGKEVNLKTVYANEKGQIGIQLAAKQVLVPTKTIPDVIDGSFKYLWQQSYMLVYGLFQFFTGQIPMEDMHGLVGIAKVGGDVIRHGGFFSGLLLTAIISLDLALVNFLPIPALDGGHFMFLLIEKLRGKPLNEETINKISSVFFLLLILFMIFVVFNDIYALMVHKL